MFAQTYPTFESPYGLLINADCLELMPHLEAESVDFILTDPPYCIGYVSRDGRTFAGEDQPLWMRPAYAEMFRLLKPDSYALTFYGWSRSRWFTQSIERAGFRIVGQMVFVKRYASRKGKRFRYRHECAFLLAKGNPPDLAKPIDDVQDFPYTGNRLHSCEKPVSMLTPLIEAFCPEDGCVLDPFAGSGSVLQACIESVRSFVGIEIAPQYVVKAVGRLMQN